MGLDGVTVRAQTDRQTLLNALHMPAAMPAWVNILPDRLS